MSEAPAVCAACGGACEEGFLPDMIGLGEMTAGLWIEGQPEISHGGSLFGGAYRRKHRLQAFRCVKCGKIELFAVAAVT